jgi:hypothetical protein
MKIVATVFLFDFMRVAIYDLALEPSPRGGDLSYFKLYDQFFTFDLQVTLYVYSIKIDT